MASREHSDRPGTSALETIREEVAALADPSGSFVVRCGRTGQRPVPVDARRFPDREAAARAALLTTEYRTRLRFWDDRTPYCDPIAHEERNGEGVRGADGGDACGNGSTRYPTSLVERVRAATDDSDGRTTLARTARRMVATATGTPQKSESALGDSSTGLR